MAISTPPALTQEHHAACKQEHHDHALGNLSCALKPEKLTGCFILLEEALRFF